MSQTRATTTELRDEPRGLREEDSFDVVAVHDWLAARLPEIAQAGPPRVKQFAGGASNLTYLLSYPQTELILRRPPLGTKAKSAHDMTREYRVQHNLRPVFPQVPRVLALCTDDSVIDADFYVMERLDGLILRRDLPEGFTLDPAGARSLCEETVATLVALHQVDPATADLADLGKGQGYVERQVSGWSRRYRAAKTENVPDFEPIMAWLAEHQPDDVATCVIHNDYRLDNLVLDPADLHVIGVLDWEMATLGDPLMDLGGALAYWVQADDDAGMQLARRQPTHVPGMMTRDEFVQEYARLSGIQVDDWSFYEVFGLFRVAVIAQQIYYRYHHGQTTNPAFATFADWVRYCEQRCRRIIGI
ncbi:MAG: phosphotransferase family protein [Actinobacteria bacterium]|nr:phosphotransferase family protein [Actinomycetota bacterium]